MARTHRVHTALGPRRVVDLASRPDLVWNRLPTGHGTKGPRLFDWALVDVEDPTVADTPNKYSGVLIRRTLTRADLTSNRVYAPTPTPLAAFVHVAG